MIYVLTNVSKTQDVPLDGTIRDFKIRYGKGLLRLHKVKITSCDVTTRVAVRLSRRSLVFCCVKLPSLPYFSLREEYGFSEKPTSKTKYLVILRYSLGIIASLFKRKLKGFGYLIIMVADKKAS